MNKPRIVCAANRVNISVYSEELNINVNEDIILIGIRHWDNFMHEQFNALVGSYRIHTLPIEQGFIDQYGKFHTRTEAWKIADENGQIINRCGGDTANGGTLFSENLY